MGDHYRMPVLNHVEPMEPSRYPQQAASGQKGGGASKRRPRLSHGPARSGHAINQWSGMDEVMDLGCLMLIDGMVSFNGGADSRAISRVLQDHQVGLYSSRLWGIKQLVPQRASSKQLPSHQIFGCGARDLRTGILAN